MDRFMPTQGGRIPFSVGKPTAPIWIIPDCPSKAGMKRQQVMDGADFTVFQECLHNAGLTTVEVFVTPFVTWTADDFKLLNPKSKAIRLSGEGRTQAVNRIAGLVAQHQPKLLIAHGDLSFALLCGRQSTLKDRGFLFPCVPPFDGFHAICTQSVKQMVWSNPEWRWYFTCDLVKAKELAEKDVIKYDEVHPIAVRSFVEAFKLLRALHKAEILSMDIEVANYEVSHISFSSDSQTGFSIPFRNGMWNEGQEVVLWTEIAKVLALPIPKVGQNFIFDVHFLLLRNNIFVHPPYHDTMIGHHVMFPDFLKGLGFLASLYVNVPQWKDMVKFDNIKADS